VFRDTSEVTDEDEREFSYCWLPFVAERHKKRGKRSALRRQPAYAIQRSLIKAMSSDHMHSNPLVIDGDHKQVPDGAFISKVGIQLASGVQVKIVPERARQQQCDRKKLVIWWLMASFC
jgi:hypothetical protein